MIVTRTRPCSAVSMMTGELGSGLGGIAGGGAVAAAGACPAPRFCPHVATGPNIPANTTAAQTNAKTPVPVQIVFINVSESRLRGYCDWTAATRVMSLTNPFTQQSSVPEVGV